MPSCWARIGRLLSPPARMNLLATDGLSYTLGGPPGGLPLTVFFKTTCPACRLAFGYLERLYQAYRAGGLTYGPYRRMALDDTLSFAAEAGDTFPFLLDATLRSVARLRCPVCADVCAAGQEWCCHSPQREFPEGRSERHCPVGRRADADASWLRWRLPTMASRPSSLVECHARPGSGKRG